MMTEANLTRLVSKLTRMRGAALKVGQFLSIQGPMRSHSHTNLH
jgi:aarF domain-containing kinase